MVKEAHKVLLLIGKVDQATKSGEKACINLAVTYDRLGSLAAGWACDSCCCTCLKWNPSVQQATFTSLKAKARGYTLPQTPFKSFSVRYSGGRSKPINRLPASCSLPTEPNAMVNLCLPQSSDHSHSWNLSGL
ncbi:hypothetical protein LguiA_002838 [Lonicera macranthoides]